MTKEPVMVRQIWSPWRVSLHTIKARVGASLLTITAKVAAGVPAATLVSLAVVTGTADGALPPGDRAGPARPEVISVRVVPSAEDATVGSGTTPSAARAGGRYIEAVEWIPHPSGQRLAVYPTDHARYEAPVSVWREAWDEVVRLEPGADHANMRDQFRCHVEFARIAQPEKPSWNLERWRPDVSYLTLVLAGCNPD